MGLLGRVWRAFRGSRRALTSTDCFLLADQSRREGRLEEAASLVAQGMALDPRSVLGHLLAASLHAALRRSAAAKAELTAALALDPRHPRALLGLARIALEVSVNGRPAGALALSPRALVFTEPLLQIPDSLVTDSLLTVDVRLPDPARGGGYTSYHYWVLQ